jgi:replicative DNA helicase
MVVVGGFPGHGKTSLALWILGQNLALGHRCLFVSYEMREAALIHRLFSQQLGIPSSRLRGGNGELSQGEWRQITEFCNTSQELPLVIADNVSLRLSGIESLVESYQPQLVFVDYLQLIRGEGKKSQHRYEVVEDLMHGFAALAHRTGVAIVLLSQLRKPEGDSEPLPRLHLLKDSSSIEQAAHAVILVQLTSDASELRQFSLTVVKNRSGRLLFWTPIYFDAPVFRFGTAETRESVLRMPEAAMGDAEI